MDSSNNIVAYIDLLAFSNHIRENSMDALMTMNNYNAVLSTMLRDLLLYPVSTYPNELQQLAKEKSMDSVDFFIPFSDSVFMLSGDCNSFIKQLGNFVLQSFLFTAHFYQHPINSSQPEKNIINNYSIDENGEIVVNTDSCNYFPALFRGGLAYGESFPIDLYSIIEGKPSKSKVITGTAVVEAVKLESKVKGPRLIFAKDVFDQLDDATKDYCRQLPEDNYLYEILWPAMRYIQQESRELNISEIKRFKELLEPAYNLWKAYNHTQFSVHYFNFIDLIIASTIQFSDKKVGLKNEAKDILNSWISSTELIDKIDLDSY